MIWPVIVMWNGVYAAVKWTAHGRDVAGTRACEASVVMAPDQVGCELSESRYIGSDGGLPWARVVVPGHSVRSAATTDGRDLRLGVFGTQPDPNGRRLSASRPWHHQKWNMIP